MTTTPGPTVGAVLLTPGAGSGRAHPGLLAIEAALAPFPVERMDFPYRRAGRRVPDQAPKLIASVVEGAEVLVQRTGVEPRQLVLGGRSMGGRICSMAVAEGLPAAGLVLVGYPLHPPGRPERLRVAHLVDLEVPCLFVSGTRDGFGTPSELEEATLVIPGPVTHVWIDGGRHELKGADAKVATAVSTWVAGL